MRIISCYVENFGKISKFAYDFGDGLNIVEEENGWGKTTFAAFIKAMFYGLEYRTGKVITDRKRYMPWNGKKFGGYLIFEKGGKQYKIERFFGKKNKEDTFVIYDMSKNVVSSDFSENIGEAIWKVDRDSYEKTAFITLNDSELLNDIISSKLGNINEQEADMETSTRAIDLLEAEIVKIKAKRGNGGFLNEKSEEIMRLKMELKECKDSLNNIEKIENWIIDEEKKLRKINEDLSEIEEEQSKFLLYEKKRQYLELIIEYNNKEKEFELLTDFFKGQNLSEEDLNKISTAASTYINQNDLAVKNQLSNEQENELEELSFKFRDEVPKSFEIEACNSNITGLSNKKTEIKSYSIMGEVKMEFEKLERKYGKINVDSSTIDRYLENFSQIVKLESEQQNINNELGKLEGLHTSRTESFHKKKINPLPFVGIGVFLLGLFFSIQSLVVGGGIAILGLILGIISFLSNKKVHGKNQASQHDETRDGLESRITEIEKKKNELKLEYSSFLKAIGESTDNVAASLANGKVEVREYNRLKNQASINEEKTNKIEHDISVQKRNIEDFLGKYCNVMLITDYERALSELRKSVARFDELSRTNKLYQDANNRAKEAKEYLKEKFKHYYEDFPVFVNDAVDELKKKSVALNLTQIDFSKLKDKKEKFEINSNVVELEQIALPDKEEDQLKDALILKKSEFNCKKEEILRKINNFEKDINEHSQKADKIEDIESTIIRLEEETNDLGKQYNLLNITKDCMEEAKENLATKYVGNMSITFEKFLKEIDTEKRDAYQIDIDLKVKLECEGELHDSSELSKGMKDLIQICMRMALVEAVYKDVDKPLLVLDDPFVNLDNDRLENATRLLKKISSEYQMIYFICHNSRNVV